MIGRWRSLVFLRDGEKENLPRTPRTLLEKERSEPGKLTRVEKEKGEKKKGSEDNEAGNSAEKKKKERGGRKSPRKCVVALRISEKGKERRESSLFLSPLS